MSIKEIIMIACAFTENEQLKDKLSQNDFNSLTSLEQEVVLSMVECFNLVNCEIATEHLPIYKREIFSTIDFKVDFSKFSTYPLQIVNVKDSKGRKIKFKVMSDYIVALCNKVEVLYTTSPQSYTFEDEFSSPIPARVYAYGIAREYYIMQTLYDEADIWQERFNSSLSNLLKRKRETRMPSRRWL